MPASTLILDTAVPNRAFMHSRPDDKFWAAQKLVAMTTDLIRAAIKAAEFGDPESEAFLATALAERRDAIARAYLTTVNPVADLALGENDTLTFGNAAVDADVAKAPEGYRAVWSIFDNVTGDSTPLGESSGRTTTIAAPDLPHDADIYIKVQVSAINAVHAAWHTPVDAYFRHSPNGWTLVGFERMPEWRPSTVGTN